MKDEEMKNLWRQHEFAPASPLPDSELVQRMKQRMRKFDRTIYQRDAREFGACALVFCGFLYFLLHQASLWSQAGCVVIMTSSCFIAWKLFAARRAHPPVTETAAVNEFMRAELAKVTRQTQMLQSVLWWYLLPNFIGMVLLEIGFRRSLKAHLFAMTFNLLVFAYVYWLNRVAVRKSLLPLKRNLERTLDPLAASTASENSEMEDDACGLKFSFRLGRHSITLRTPDDWPWSLRFCVAMNACWVAVPCGLLDSRSLVHQAFPKLGSQAFFVVLALVAWMASRRALAHMSRWKFAVLGVAAVSGLYAMAWAWNVVFLLRHP